MLHRLKLITPLLHTALEGVEESRVSDASPLACLSPAEEEVLRWVAAGRSNGEIATLRGRSVATVRNQLHQIYTKLGVNNRAEAIRVVLTSTRS